MTATRRRYDDTTDRQTHGVALLVVLAFHLLLFGLMYTNGFHRSLPLPREQGIEIALEKELPVGTPVSKPRTPVRNPPIVNTAGNTAPQSAALAESNQSTKPMEQPEAKPSDLSDQGDVDEPAKEPKVNQKALFQSNTQGAVDADRPNSISDKSLFPGVGTSDQSTRTADTPIGPEHRQMVSANLNGRSVVGSLPLPAYNSQNEGRVVVNITVDQNGRVTKATAVGVGSTVQDAELWKAAERAAMKARFNVKRDAPVFQTGTITYVFRLN